MSGYVKWRKREIWLAFPVDRARKLADELLPSCEWQQVTNDTTGIAKLHTFLTECEPCESTQPDQWKAIDR